MASTSELLHSNGKHVPKSAGYKSKRNSKDINSKKPL